MIKSMSTTSESLPMVLNLIPLVIAMISFPSLSAKVKSLKAGISLSSRCEGVKLPFSL